MRASTLITAATSLASLGHALNVLITNDDGFGSSNIREMYNAVKAAGHNAWIVASATDQSGQGGRAVFTRKAILDHDSEWGIIRSGQPSFGNDPYDDHIFYYDGTPAAMVFIGLDYVLPQIANVSKPDIVLAGPNFGTNIGPFMYGMSGTMGATYAAVERGIPAIAFSGAFGMSRAYYQVKPSTKIGLQDPSTIMGRLAAALLESLLEKAKGSKDGRLLPVGYGLNVNFPRISSLDDKSCLNPPYIHTRFTGGAHSSRAIWDDKSKIFNTEDVSADGANMCINGDCSLPGESDVVNKGCQSSVTLFTVDYDAPIKSQGSSAVDPQTILPDLVQLQNSTELVGGLGGNASFAPGPATQAASKSDSTGKSSSAAATIRSNMGMLSNVAATALVTVLAFNIL